MNLDYIDGGGCFVILLFVELYIYFDVVLMVGEFVWNMSGMLFEGIECWVECKVIIMYEDIKMCVYVVIGMLCDYGIQYVCMYVDVIDLMFVVLKVMLEVKDEVCGLIDL